ncbi:MAG: hypothetical protein IJ060_03860 [Oscillospiraceae bacterium]|nr:hypothetical protein [Oscillospiraceae bacterium]
MAEKNTLQKLESPAEPEKPEEGFVPYAAEAAAEEKSGRKHKKLILIPLILLSVIALAAGVLLLLTRFNRYHSVMKNLKFDYRAEEIPGGREGVEQGARSIALADRIGSQPVRVKAAVYLLDDNGKTDQTVLEYNYLSSMGLTQLKTVSSAASSIRSQTTELRTKGEGYETLEDGEWKPAEKGYIPPLYDYFFEVRSHNNITIGCYDTYETQVGGKDYICEIWLIDEQIGDTVQYDTVYRYYDGESLAGVIVLRDSDNWKEVFDIQSYEINPAL